MTLKSRFNFPITLVSVVGPAREEEGGEVVHKLAIDVACWFIETGWWAACAVPGPMLRWRDQGCEAAGWLLQKVVFWLVVLTMWSVLWGWPWEGFWWVQLGGRVG